MNSRLGAMIRAASAPESKRHLLCVMCCKAMLIGIIGLYIRIVLSIFCVLIVGADAVPCEINVAFGNIDKE